MLISHAQDTRKRGGGQTAVTAALVVGWGKRRSGLALAHNCKRYRHVSILFLASVYFMNTEVSWLPISSDHWPDSVQGD